MPTVTSLEVINRWLDNSAIKSRSFKLDNISSSKFLRFVGDIKEKRKEKHLLLLHPFDWSQGLLSQ